MQVDGITGRGEGSGGASVATGGSTGEGNLAESAVAAALRYRAQAPVIDGLMKELGFDGATLDGLVAAAAKPDQPAAPPDQG